MIALIDGAVFLLPVARADAPAPSSDPRLARPVENVADFVVEAVATPTPTPSPTPTETPSPAPTATPTPTPTPKATPKPTPRDTVWNARTYVKNRIGAKQYNCVNAIWTKESKWDPRAGTPSGAYGIPQAFPGSKMAAFGSNWRYSPLTQVKWGIWYVYSRYGSACAAYEFWSGHAWY
jgi:hypothetical protein